MVFCGGISGYVFYTSQLDKDKIRWMSENVMVGADGSRREGKRKWRGEKRGENGYLAIYLSRLIN